MVRPCTRHWCHEGEILVKLQKPNFWHDTTDPRVIETWVRRPITPQMRLALYSHHDEYKCRSAFGQVWLVPKVGQVYLSLLFAEHTCWVSSNAVS